MKSSLTKITLTLALLGVNQAVVAGPGCTVIHKLGATACRGALAIADNAKGNEKMKNVANIYALKFCIASIDIVEKYCQ